MEIRRGQIDEAFVRKHVPDLGLDIFYIARPDTLTMAMRKMLLGMGVNKDNVTMEAFSGY